MRINGIIQLATARFGRSEPIIDHRRSGSPLYAANDGAFDGALDLAPGCAPESDHHSSDGRSIAESAAGEPTVDRNGGDTAADRAVLNEVLGELIAILNHIRAGDYDLDARPNEENGGRSAGTR